MRKFTTTLAIGLLSAAALISPGCADNDMLQGTTRHEVPLSEVPQDVRDLFARRGATITQVEEHRHSERDKYYVIHYTTQDGRQQKLRYEVRE
jgi:hypothetical protein